MKRILLSLGLLSAFAIQASAASLNLTITNPTLSDFGVVNRGQSYNVFGSIAQVTGDVDSYSFLRSGGGAPAGFTFTPSASFNNYLLNLNGQGGTGAEFGTTAANGQVTGGGGGGLLGSIFISQTAPAATYVNVLGVTDSASGQFDGENLSATIATPEPASFAALGVGAIALLRRRRKA